MQCETRLLNELTRAYALRTQAAADALVATDAAKRAGVEQKAIRKIRAAAKLRAAGKDVDLVEVLAGIRPCPQIEMCNE